MDENLLLLKAKTVMDLIKLFSLHLFVLYVCVVVCEHHRCISVVCAWVLVCGCLCVR